jgi:Domain of unknown function (DUF4326)
MTPQRIQLSRRKGYRKPAGAVVVARPTKWGNPCRWDEYPAIRVDDDGEPFRISPTARRGFAVTDFQSQVVYGDGYRGYPALADIRRELAGRDLACWCPLDGPCHADVLLAVANGATS